MMMRKLVVLSLWLTVLFSCGDKNKLSENQKRDRDHVPVTAPRIDTMHFKIIKPTADLLISSYSWLTIEWGNPNEELLKKVKKTVLFHISVCYNESEELHFINYGRPFLRKNIDGGPDDTLHERFTVSYSYLKKTYDVDYHAPTYGDKPIGWGGEGFGDYHRTYIADSILALWGEKPLKEWGEK
jgi:hypothetical protein